MRSTIAQIQLIYDNLSLSGISSKALATTSTAFHKRSVEVLPNVHNLRLGWQYEKPCKTINNTEYLTGRCFLALPLLTSTVYILSNFLVKYWQDQPLDKKYRRKRKGTTSRLIRCQRLPHEELADGSQESSFSCPASSVNESRWFVQEVAVFRSFGQSEYHSHLQQQQ